MHSIVVLGDVRTHIVTAGAELYWRKEADCPPPQHVTKWRFAGGAVMMAKAVELALQNLKGPKPDLHSFEATWREGDATTLEENQAFWEWELRPHLLAGQATPRPRLQLKSYVGGRTLILGLTQQFEDILCKNYPFEWLDKPLSHNITTRRKQWDEKRKEHAQEDKPELHAWEAFNEEAKEDAPCWCPDIAVFDDLSASFRSLDLDLDAGKKGPKSLFAGAGGTEEMTKAAMEDLFRRFILLQEHSEQKRNPVMEPVIVASIQGDVSTALSPTKEKSFWRHLYNNAWLRERVVVLMDARDLRSEGLAVSTGLSWERTVQDTISQIHRSKSIRKFLNFGQVIIRYGATGALHIVRRGANEWSYTLHFHPTEIDSSWAAQGVSGHLIGHSSVFASSIVRELVKQCNEVKGGGNMYIGRLPSYISRSLKHAIEKCCTFAESTGYGKTCVADFEEILIRPTHEKDCTTLLPKTLYSDKCNENKYTEIISVATNQAGIQNWSVTGQSLQSSSVKDVAQSIIRYGADHVLNQPIVNLEMCAGMIDSFGKNFFSNPLSGFEEKELIDFSRSDQMWFWELGVKSISSEGVGVAERVVEVAKPKEVRTYSTWQIEDWFVKCKGPEEKYWNSLFKYIQDLLLQQNKNKKKDNKLKWPKLKIGDATFQEKIQDVVKPPSNYLPFAAPVARYGAKGKRPLTVLDRREVEGFRAIEKLMRKHIQAVRDETNDRPLCLAVFGPPGSGKSMSVKQINASLGDDLTQVLDPFNLAQFGSPADLDSAFDEILRNSGGKKIPIAFFDEFDCRFPNDPAPLGWLKFFLSPMEDGLFNRKEVRNAILVFAGGTSSTFSEFRLSDRSTSDPQWVKFSQAKGPDFISRLNGHLDIVGINPTDDDELYLIRRAIVMRHLLSQSQHLEDGERASIDDSMIKAFLHVPEYKHGARAMRMLLDLCTDASAKVTSSAVPPIHQIDMFVDGKSFIHEYRG